MHQRFFSLLLYLGTFTKVSTFFEKKVGSMQYMLEKQICCVTGDPGLRGTSHSHIGVKVLLFSEHCSQDAEYEDRATPLA
jgi:hypothetical protein